MDASQRSLTRTALTNTFVPFGLLLVIALLAAETSQNLALFRAQYAIWLSLAFFAVAFCLFILPDRSTPRTTYWLLCWTFGFVAFLIYTLYTVVGMYRGDVGEFYNQRGVLTAAGTLLLVLWWGLDVALAWTASSAPPWTRAQRAALQSLLFLCFFTMTVIGSVGRERFLGLVLTVSVAVCVLIRLTRDKERS